MTAHWAPSRHVALDGAVNVRDIGGYRTSYGLQVTRGRLFRGDALSQLTGPDVERLDRLGLRTVIDFRTPGEVLLTGADRLPFGTEFVSLPVGGGDLGSIYELIASGDHAATAAGTRRRARGRAHGRDQPRVRDGRAAAGGVRRRAPAGVLGRAAAAAVPLLGREGPDRVDDRHRAHRARRAARARAAGLPAVQRLPPNGLPEAPVRPGQDRDRGRSRAAAADHGAKRHVPGHGLRGGGAEVLLVRPVRDARAGDQRRDAGRAAAHPAR